MGEMHIPALIFSRMDSTRLPGKALRMLAGRTVLDRVTSRVKMSRDLDGVIVCTSTRDIDDPIAAFAENDPALGLFRGDVDDVLGRALNAARAENADAIVRISGDSPFIDPHVINQIVMAHRSSDVDLTTNVHPRTYPTGMSVEVINTDALIEIDEKKLSARDREHVTVHFYENADQWRIQNIPAEPPLRDVDLALDTEQEFAFQSWIAERIGDNARLNDIVALARKYKEQEAAS